MKAIAVNRTGEAGRPHLDGSDNDTIHLRTDVAEPSLEEHPDGRGVLVKILQVGTCGTDREINRGEYGQAPPENDFLVLGHECFGEVLEVGPKVKDFKPGDLVTATVRRPGTGVLDRMFFHDMTHDDVYFERGINLLHGFFCERIVEHESFLIKMPGHLKEIGVLSEPMSVVQKGIRLAYFMQQARFPDFHPRKALVTGAGAIGQLAALALRLRRVEVVVSARTPGPHRKAELLDHIGTRYVATEGANMAEVLESEGPFDIIFESSGSSKVAIAEAPFLLAKNGVCIWSSISGGEGKCEVRTDEINQAAVLGNQLFFGTVNAHLIDFERGVRDFEHAMEHFTGWLPQLLTNKIDLSQATDRDAPREIIKPDRDGVKAYVNLV